MHSQERDRLPECVVELAEVRELYRQQGQAYPAELPSSCVDEVGSCDTAARSGPCGRGRWVSTTSLSGLERLSSR